MEQRYSFYCIVSFSFLRSIGYCIVSVSRSCFTINFPDLRPNWYSFYLRWFLFQREFPGFAAELVAFGVYGDHCAFCETGKGDFVYL